MVYIFLYIIIILIINEFFIRKKYIQSFTGSKHQRFVNSSVPLTGGIFLILPIIYVFFNNFIFMSLILILLFLVGIFSDLNLIISPKKRFLIQFFLVSAYVLLTKLHVLPTRIFFIDKYLSDSILVYFFTIFCLMILINGSNFIDGLNGLFLGYFLIVNFIFYKNNLIQDIISDQGYILYLFIILVFVLILNFLNRLFLGDSGAYLLSFLMGFISIKIYNLNNNLSPYFIITLLWYPCFENLFSIIRKKIDKVNPLLPDNKHLHQYLYNYIVLKFKLSQKLSNGLSSLMINLFNLILFLIASKYYESSIIQLLIITCSIAIYVISYQFFKLKSSY